MILTGTEIHKELEKGGIVIDPFSPKHLGPNSYDVTLNSKLLVYDYHRDSEKPYLDMKEDNPTRELHITEEGLVLEPNVLYLGCTNETATSQCYVPMFEGRSSIGRLGINTHITAGFGDLGWGFTEKEDGNYQCHYPTWTLEIAVVHPVKIYPNTRIGQVYFLVPQGDISFYKGKYSKQKDPQASQLFKDFKANT
jgi:dCTP deaminase